MLGGWKRSCLPPWAGQILGFLSHTDLVGTDTLLVYIKFELCETLCIRYMGICQANALAAEPFSVLLLVNIAVMLTSAVTVGL